VSPTELPDWTTGHPIPDHPGLHGHSDEIRSRQLGSLGYAKDEAPLGFGLVDAFSPVGDGAETEFDREEVEQAGEPPRRARRASTMFLACIRPTAEDQGGK